MNDAASVEDSICTFNIRMQELSIKLVRDFQCMFERTAPSAAAPYRFTEITSKASFDTLWAGRGFYLILSDYAPLWERQGQCSLSVGGLRVLYRGQADKVRERLMSHLENDRYRRLKNEKGHTGWERCLKLDEIQSNKGGICINNEPFNSAHWACIVLPMPDSSSQMRERVEWAFDRAFGKPVASNERKVIPKAVTVALDKQEAEARRLKIITAEKLRNIQ